MDLLARLEVADTAIDGPLLQGMRSVPAQFYSARRDSSEVEPIKKLMAAILVDALQCYRKGQRQTVKGVEALKARAWIFSSYAEFPFSFITVCTELGLSPQRVRKQLRESDEPALAGGRPNMLRRPPIRTLKVQGERQRAGRSSPRETQAG